MTTRHITTDYEQDVCDVCGRTLLRGESTEAFLDGPRRYAVCELCKPQALHDGWVREGTIPDFQGSTGAARPRRSLFGRLRGRGPSSAAATLGEHASARTAPRTLDDELSAAGWQRAGLDRGAGGRAAAPAADLAAGGSAGAQRTAERHPPAAEAAGPRERRRARGRGRGREDAGSAGSSSGRSRRVHAVPTSGDHKVIAAIEAFNGTEHTRTVAGVSRSLGAAGISLRPDLERSTIVWVVAWWELCWYRYEIELSDDPGSVRLDAQGYELDELTEAERTANAIADADGRLSVG